MASYGDMIDRMKFELDRSVSSEDEHIRRAIISAIDTYKTERFAWNVKRLTFTMTIGDPTYATNFQRVDNSATHGIEDVIQVDWMMCIPTGGGSRRYDLRRIDGKTLDALQGITSTGRPIYWDLNSSQIRIFPDPDAAHSAEFRALMDVSDLVYDSSTSDGTTNPWMNEAEEMVRSRALANCYSYWLKDINRGQMMRQLADQEFYRHRNNYDRLVNGDKGITPWYGEADLDRGVFTSL